MQSEIQQKEIGLLSKAFESFTEATAKLEESYSRLEKRVESLNLELEEKNAQLERNLREKENVKNYLHDILESLPTGVVVVAPNHYITTFNKTAEKIVGVGARNALGKPFEEIFGLRESDTLPLNQLLAPESDNRYLEIQFINRKNVELDLSISSSTMKSPLDGRLEKTLIIQDITNLKRMEEKLERNDRLTAMGEMAAGIAHELRNPLGSIELFSSLLKRELIDKPESGRIVDHISTGVKKMDHIISGLLAFTRSPKPNVRRYNLHEILEDILLFNDLMIRNNNIKVIKNFNCKAPYGVGDADLLSQAFTNFILNAVQSMAQGGVLSITTGEDGETPSEAGNEASKNRNLLLVVSDTGAGIPTHLKTKIFNPFFTTKDHGTGLGLAIVHSTVKAHNGSIEFESSEGKGTSFTVSLPAWQNQDGH